MGLETRDKALWDQEPGGLHHSIQAVLGDSAKCVTAGLLRWAHPDISANWAKPGVGSLVGLSTAVHCFVTECGFLYAHLIPWADCSNTWDKSSPAFWNYSTQRLISHHWFFFSTLHHEGFKISWPTQKTLCDCQFKENSSSKGCLKKKSVKITK